MLQVLERSGFDYEKDKLISLGDIADGWTDIAECFDELLKIKNLVVIRGNHDQWLLDWMESGDTPALWVEQGGRNTLRSYAKYSDELKNKHHDFLKTTPFYYVDDGRLFVHGGYDDTRPLSEQNPEELMWDRSLLNEDKANRISHFKEVYVGHTTVWRISDTPLTVGKVTFMDTGGGWEGKLSLMNIDTKEVFQSDLLKELYPNVRPR